MKKVLYRLLGYTILFYVLILIGVSMAVPGNLGITKGRLADPPESPNCVSSHADSTDSVHYISPLVYEGTSEAAIEAIVKVIENWPRAKVITQEENYFHVVCTTLIFRFKDDLEIFVDQEQKKIHFRSASRVGYSDLGTNRKRVNKFKETLKQFL
ncbi:MAG: DUF1499 domain-containing protein [Lentisphaerales bacterium]|nr:DUF1499 domain-containing protein [Lentisphaerales bacterium]